MHQVHGRNYFKGSCLSTRNFSTGDSYCGIHYIGTGSREDTHRRLRRVSIAAQRGPDGLRLAALLETRALQVAPGAMSLDRVTRVVGFPPHPQTQHKFQCWRG